MKSTADAGFEALGSYLSLSGPRRWVDPIACAYERFRSETPSAAVRVAWSPGRPNCRVGDVEIPWLEAFDGATQFYNHFLGALLDGVGGHAVLHAAAGVDARGEGFLIAAPSG